MQTVVFEVPYRPNENLAWDVRRDDRLVGQFPSRVDALRYAVHEAVHAGNEALTALVTVEGADGVRRLFGGDVKRPLEELPFGARPH
ncbi:hypothetical protein EC912_10159 [Luteibacter rhizovicinus]|uniref:DUF2188 domain-containing protein n=1 Tax=Luteibacter rhizovicinus TaxID=242606 RepID=A0A4R3YVD4_9GAMM|nr:hypothetical protein [Luteibacter rhizovicinus]TCV97065.1 hypothetical protein EC912_10159 [Luteibacter rhizovicinus]